jgi:hypothetical protein
MTVGHALQDVSEPGKGLNRWFLRPSAMGRMARSRRRSFGAGASFPLLQEPVHLSRYNLPLFG